MAIELLTPFKQATNVDLKAMKKFITDMKKETSDYKIEHVRLQRTIDEMSVTIIKAMKLEKQEKVQLEKELTRLQQIDRIKVSHANTMFFNPDTGSYLPSIDTCNVSASQDFDSKKLNVKKDGRDSGTP